VLHALGLAEPLRAVAVVPRSIDSRDWQTGEILGRVPLSAAALARYGARRRERTAAMQAGSRDAGRTMHLAVPDEVHARNTRMRADPAAHVARYDWIYGDDVRTALTGG
jgi:hypothetical protein